VDYEVAEVGPLFQGMTVNAGGEKHHEDTTTSVRHAADRDSLPVDSTSPI
jgi:hypothetical protein